MITALASLLILAIVELSARWFEARTIKAAQVATDPESDHMIGSVGQLLRLGAFVLTAVFVAAVFWLGGLALASAMAVIGFAVLRAALVLLDKAAAQASRGARLARALKTPAFKEARLAFFFSAPDLQTPDHVRAWEEEMEGTGLDWFCITAEPHHFAALRAQGRHKAVLLPDLTTSLHLLPAGLKAILYANNGQKNRSVIRALPHVLHTQILHGDSDKPPSYSPLTKNYDRVFVAGQMAIDRYGRNGVDIPEERFRIVGRPQVAAITPKGEGSEGAQDVPQIGYMPTWRGFFEDTQFSSLDRAAEIIDTIGALPQKVHVIFKPHPMSYKDPDWSEFEKQIKAALAARRASGSTGQISPPDMTPFDLYNRADVLICDISSVMIDFLYADKPFITVLPQGFKDEDRFNLPSLEASYEAKADLSDLSAALEAALGDDPLSAKRADVRASAFGDLDLPAGEAFRRACYELIGETAPARD